MTEKTMAEVLAEHQDWTYKRNLGYYRSEYLCRCGERFWHGDHAEDPTFNEAVAAHQSAALSAAGFGLVADAKAEAFDYGWREGAGWPTPINTETGELLHAEAQQAPHNPYRAAS